MPQVKIESIAAEVLPVPISGEVSLASGSSVEVTGTIGISAGSVLPVSGDIEAAPANPTDKYKLSDMDTGGATEYYGYIDKDENWYILQLTTTAARYCSGAGGYPAAWDDRVPPGQTYDYFDEVF